MWGRVTLLLALAAITAGVLALGAGGTPAAPKTKTAVGETTIQCEAGKVCKGTSGDDVIYGTDGDDDINPYGGNDTVYAGPGNDTVHHSYGNDTIYGGPGADTLRGGFGHDLIYDNDADPTQLDTLGNPIPIHDEDHDLIDCAYLGTRGDSGPDVGYGDQKDTVVDCSNRDDQ